MYTTGRIFTNCQTGGIKRFEELTRFLQQNFNADLCCQDDDVVLRENGLYRTYRFKEKKGSKIFPPEMKRLIANMSLLKQIKKEKYDSIVSFDVPPTIGLCLMGVSNIVLMIRKDLIGYEQISSIGAGLKKKLKLFYLRCCERLCLKKAKRIIVQCKYDKDQLINRHICSEKKIRKKFCVQINNVNPSWILKKSESVQSSTKKDGLFHICFIGNFDNPRKGHDILLETAVKLHREGCRICFNIVGAGKDFEKYRNKYENDLIRFYGSMNNPMHILKSCNLVVVPSLVDSCPNTVMESLYNGIPVIGSRRGGIPEILEDDIALFEPNVKSLAQKIRSLYSDTKQLTDMKYRQMRRKAVLEFDWASKISKIICSL